MVTATALAETGPTLIVTSDVPHLSALVNGRDQVSVVHVDKMGPIEGLSAAGADPPLHDDRGRG
ncbi:MAG: hypothetical protein JWN52_4655 [Actinomycetia bacterium]|nr:hypothetical protein [Actinomycetes bacterium]